MDLFTGVHGHITRDIGIIYAFFCTEYTNHNNNKHDSYTTTILLTIIRTTRTIHNLS